MQIWTRFLPRSNPFMNVPTGIRHLWTITIKDQLGLRFRTVMCAFPVPINKNQTIRGIKELKKDFGSGSNRGKMDFSRG